MSSSEEAIKRVVEAFERSGWSEIDVRSGDMRVHLSTAGASGIPTTPNEAFDATVREVPDDGGGDRDIPEPDPAAPGLTRTPPAGAQLLVSPSPGIFWRSPEPGRPPFADVGDTVDPSSTMCIIEVMKLMTHVKAGVRGDVVAVYAGNGVAVQKGEALFAIVPAGSST